jgi:hypothetical protein
MDEEFKLDDEENLYEALEELGKIDPSIAKAMKDELKGAQEDDNNILMIGTNGEVTVTIIHVPSSALNNKKGPILLPTADPVRIVAAVSRESLAEWLKKKEKEIIDPLMIESAWSGMLQRLYDRTIILNDNRPHLLIDDINPLKEEEF